MIKTKFYNQYNIVLILMFFAHSFSWSQIQGYIIDSEKGEAVPEATIYISGANWTTSSSSGYFKIAPKGNDTLVISHIGYKTLKLPINENKFLTILLVPEYFQLENVNVNGWHGMKYIKQLTGNISVVTPKDGIIKNNMNEYLEQTPGIEVNYGAFNTNKVVIRGIGSRAQYGTFGVKAYINNIPVTSGDGAVSLEDFPPDFFSRIEVFKGPSSSMYGAGLGGVVKMNTGPSLNVSPKINIETSYASFNTIRNNFSINMKKQNVGLKIGGSNVQSNGYRENSSFERLSFIVLPEYTKTRFRVNGLFLYSGINAYIPSSINEETYLNSPKSAATNWTNVQGYENYDRVIGGLGTVINVSPMFYINSNVYMNFMNSYERRPFNTRMGDNFSFGTRSFVTFSPPLVETVLGFENMIEQGDWQISETVQEGHGEALNSSFEIKQFNNIFLLARSVKADNLNWNISISANDMKYTLKDTFSDSVDLSNNIVFKWQLSPRLGINYKLGDKENIYASVSSGFSPPSFEETLNTEGVFNENIKPATGIMYETGIRGRILKKTLYYDITLYHTTIEKLLVTRRLSEEIFMQINAGKTRHMGIENTLQLNWPYSESKNGVNVSTTFTYNIASHIFVWFPDNGMDFSNNKLPGVAKNNLYLLSVLRKNNFFVKLKFYYKGSMYLNDLNDTKTDPYSHLAFNSGTNFKYKRFKIQATIGINNIFNQIYPAMVLINAPSFGGNPPRYYYPSQPRNYSITLGISFE